MNAGIFPVKILSTGSSENVYVRMVPLRYQANRQLRDLTL
jgi:hypothetical protein